MKSPTIKQAESLTRACGGKGAILLSFGEDEKGLTVSGSSYGVDREHCECFAGLIDWIVDNILKAGAQ